MSTEEIRLEADRPVARLIVDRPHKHNAISLEMWRRLPELIERVSADTRVKVLVVQGAGEAAFAAGADIEELLAHADSPARAALFMDTVQRAERALALCAKPTIAMIRGTCFGGGIELALACDVRFASVGSRFSIPPARLGVVYSLSSTRRLIELIGPGVARDLLFSGRAFDSGEARTMGLIEREFALAEIEQETERYAELLCRRSQFSIRAAKRVTRAILDGAVEENDALRELRVDAFLGADVREGASAFLEKRPAEFPWS